MTANYSRSASSASKSNVNDVSLMRVVSVILSVQVPPLMVSLPLSPQTESTSTV